MTVEVQYYCDRCEQKFVVYHDDEHRLKCCGWCGNQISPTRRIRTREGDLIVTYMNGLKTKEETAFGAGMATRSRTHWLMAVCYQFSRVNKVPSA